VVKSKTEVEFRGRGQRRKACDVGRGVDRIRAISITLAPSRTSNHSINDRIGQQQLDSFVVMLSLK